ncbi:hypothetical protein L195_g039584 [Trifolium pratense]|uniref:Uncharacterized protein n=1 Tax=Trifolium pratense TaxID=57577 RepID=A0A2K3LYC3_TRIPR|nr:hypothetical protein L195_g039584 [Trifolium pratense]
MKENQYQTYPDAETSSNDSSDSHWSFFKWFHTTTEDIRRINEDMIAFIIRDEIHPNPLSVYDFKGKSADRSVIKQLNLDDVEYDSTDSEVYSRGRWE